jgi:hypothetical protein
MDRITDIEKHVTPQRELGHTAWSIRGRYGPDLGCNYGSLG